MMKYFASELHCHTIHSDGYFTVDQLCLEAKKAQLDIIALTDHNTASGICEITKELEDNTLPVIKGIELTTYFGHMLVLGSKKFVDWRKATPENIDNCISEIKSSGGVVGLAHPFDLGSPMCTGGHWEFKVKNWSNVDFIEVWHEDFPSIKTANLRSLNFWNSLLDKGFKIGITYGRDWHGASDKSVPFACTYLGIESGEITAELAKDAIKKGRCAVSMGPKFVIYLNNNDGIFHIGDTINQGGYTVYFDIDFNLRRSIWGKHDIRASEIRLVGNGGKVIQSIELNSQITKSNVDLKKGWARGELWGEVNGIKCCIAITGAVYIR